MAEEVPIETLPEVMVGGHYRFAVSSGDAELDAEQPFSVATLDETALVCISAASMIAHTLNHASNPGMDAAFTRAVKALASGDMEGWQKASAGLAWRISDAHGERMTEAGHVPPDPEIQDRALFTISAMITTLRSLLAVREAQAAE